MHFPRIHFVTATLNTMNNFPLPSVLFLSNTMPPYSKANKARISNLKKLSKAHAALPNSQATVAHTVPKAEGGLSLQASVPDLQTTPDELDSDIEWDHDTEVEDSTDMEEGNELEFLHFREFMQKAHDTALAAAHEKHKGKKRPCHYSGSSLRSKEWHVATRRTLGADGKTQFIMNFFFVGPTPVQLTLANGDEAREQRDGQGGNEGVVDCMENDDEAGEAGRAEGDLVSSRSEFEALRVFIDQLESRRRSPFNICINTSRKVLLKVLYSVRRIPKRSGSVCGPCLRICVMMGRKQGARHTSIS